jgi:hypothetical protein
MSAACLCAMHWPVAASQSRTSWSSEPEASSVGLRGWKRTTQGVRRCPVRTLTSLPVAQLVIFTVWSPLQPVQDNRDAIGQQ